MKSIKLNICWWTCCFFLFVYMGTIVAEIQVQSVPQAGIVQKTSEPEKPSVIPITEISDRAQETSIILNKIMPDLMPDPAITEILKQLPSFLSSLKRLRTDLPYESLNNLTTRKLQELSQEWTMHLGKLNAWEGMLSERSDKLEEDHNQLKGMIELWQVTGESAIFKEAPEAIQKRVKTTLNEITKTKTKLSEHIEVLLTCKDQISEQQLEITKLITLINTAESQSLKRLLMQDSLPLWKIIRTKADIQNFGSRIHNAFAVFLRRNMTYIQANLIRCSFHIIIFTILLAGMIYCYLRNKRNHLFDEISESLKATSFFLSYPFSTAFMISIFIGAWIYTNPPVTFRLLIILFALIPVLRLVPGIFLPELHRPIYFLTGMCVLSVLDKIFGEYILLQRFLLFMITIIAIPLFVWWLRPKSIIYQIKTHFSKKIAIGLGFLLLILFSVSLVTNVIGIFSLAEILVTGMVNILFVSVAIYVIALILDGFVALLIRRRSARALHIVEAYASILERRAIYAVHLILIFFWLRMALRTFGVYQNIWDWFFKISEYKWRLGTIEISLGAVFSFIFILTTAFILARVVRVFLEIEIFSRFHFPRGVPGAISMMVRYTIIGFGFFLAISAVGVDLGKFGLLAGAMGVGLGFGLRNIIENFVSGLIIIFERPIEVGDTVEIGNVLGNVEKIGIRSSTVKTFDGSEVIVPNAQLISNQVSNWTMSDRQRRIQLPVKVAFGNDPHQVLHLLLNVAREHKGVLNIPEPMAIFNGFGDNYLDFTLNYWVSDNILKIKSEVALGVHDAINKAGIDTPRPKGDFNLKIMDTQDKEQMEPKGDSNT